MLYYSSDNFKNLDKSYNLSSPVTVLRGSSIGLELIVGAALFNLRTVFTLVLIGADLQN